MSEDDEMIKSYKPSGKLLLEFKEVEATCLLWMAVHGNLCLALRHPDNRGESRELVVKFVKKLGRLLVEWGVMTEGQLNYTERIEAGEGSRDLRPER